MGELYPGSTDYYFVKFVGTSSFAYSKCVFKKGRDVGHNVSFPLGTFSYLLPTLFAQHLTFALHHSNLRKILQVLRLKILSIILQRKLIGIILYEVSHTTS